jgi:hypothetical protein
LPNHYKNWSNELQLDHFNFQWVEETAKK